MDNDALIWFQLGDAYRVIGWHREAALSYREALRIDPEDYETWLKLGECYGRSGDTDQAVEAFLRVARLQPENTRNWGMLGSQFQVHRTKVEEVYRTLEKYDPQLAEKFYLRYGFLGPDLR
ncbi:MAG: tetratricopeptide repeat protein [Burkholderiales bacterium]